MNTRHTRSLPSMALALGKPQGYVMLARSGDQGGGSPLAGRGVSPPKLFLSGRGVGSIKLPWQDSWLLVRGKGNMLHFL